MKYFKIYKFVRTKFCNRLNFFAICISDYENFNSLLCVWWDYVVYEKFWRRYFSGIWNILRITMFLLDYMDYEYYICTSTSNNSLMPIKNTPSHILFPFNISLHHIAKLLSCSINSFSILGYNKNKLKLKHMYKWPLDEVWGLYED